jgi:hypothetical protein
MIIKPHTGVDALVFGMSRDEVADIIRQTPQRGRRNEFDASDYDFFEEHGFFAYYDADEKCQAVEFTRDAQVEYEGYDLFAHSASEVRTWAEKRDPHLNREDGFNSKKLGLKMYAPLINEPDLTEEEKREPAQSMLIYSPGALEKEQARIDAA